MCQQLGWRMNLEKSELEPNQDFDFVGYQFRLQEFSVQKALIYYTLNKSHHNSFILLVF